MQLLANVMFPAFMTPYIAPLFMPLMLVWILGAEWQTLIYLLKKDAIHNKAITFKKRWVLVVVLFANFASSSVGMLLSFWLPSGIGRIEKIFPDGTVEHIPGLDEFWGTYAITSFALAYLLSIIIEGGVFWITNRFRALNPWKKSLYVNSASYGGIVMYLLFVYHQFLIKVLITGEQ